MPRPLVATALALAALLCSCRSHERTVGKYQPGQLWCYKTRVGEEQSQLMVEHVVENRNGEEAVFIAVNNLRVVTNPYLREELHSLSSFPFTRQALDSSVTELVQAHTNLPLSATADLLGPSPTEWRKGDGKPINLSVADFVRSIAEAKETPTRYDTPLKPPLPGSKPLSRSR